MKDIYKRIAKLEKLTDHSGFLTVTFRDGTKRKLDAGTCIDIVRDTHNDVVAFEGGDGKLASLFNGLLDNT